jgi:hypothetical protein
MSRPMFRAVLFVAIGVGALGQFLNAYPGTVAPSADLSAAIAAKNAATGPLRVLAANPRYFTDGSGKAVYLAGSHTWADMQDTGKNDPPPPFDFAGYLDFLYAHHHNFFRLWACALPRGTEGLCNPFPWPRTGPGDASDGKPRFDLAKFDPTYFDRLRSFVRAAGERGIYVSVMLFDGYRIEFERQPDDGYPLDAGNNVNGITAPGVSSQDLSRSDVTSVQDAYVKKVVDTVNDLDNVLYEIANEAGPYSTEWQYHVITLVKDYEAKLPKQHPVGMTYQHKGGTDAALFDSPADWVSPSAPLPPDQKGRKVVINDTDHSFYYTEMQEAGQIGQRAWAWENFARGHNLAFMDPYLDVWPGRNAPHDNKVDPYWDEIRNTLGDIHRYAERIDLATMTPQPGLVVGDEFCLANPGSQYLVFDPIPANASALDRAVRLLRGHSFTLTTVPGTYAYEWFNPSTHAVAETGTATVGTTHSFTAPFASDAVLWLHK